MPKEILLYGDIEGESAKETFYQLDNAKNSDVVLRFNGDGGELRYGWAIIAKAKEIKGSKLFKNDGEAKSMMAFAFCYNDNNEAIDTASFMFHRASFGDYEKTSMFNDNDRKELIDNNTKLRAALEAKVDVAAFERITGTTMDKLFSIDSRVEVTLTAKQALECKLINRVVQITPEYQNEIQVLAARSNRPALAAHTPTPTNMTPEKLKAEHREVYNAIYAKGVKRGTEKAYENVETILPFIETDPKRAVEALKTRKALSASDQTEFLRKEFAKGAVAVIEGEAAPAVKTNPANTAADITEAQKTLLAFKNDVMKSSNYLKDRVAAPAAK